MNIFLTGSSSPLASAFIEHCFQQNDNLFVCDSLPEEIKKIPETIRERTSGQRMEAVILLHGDEIFNAPKRLGSFKTIAPRLLNQTRAVCKYFSQEAHTPLTFALASSTSIYAEATATVNEDSPLGDDYLATFYKQLERSTKALENKGIRILHLRFGQLLSQEAIPPLPKLPLLDTLVPSSLKDSSRRIGWISREDGLRALCFLLESPEITSPVNVTSGDVVSKKEFLDCLGHAFNLRRTWPMPHWLLQCMTGKQRASIYNAQYGAAPAKLHEKGFIAENISIQEYLSLVRP